MGVSSPISSINCLPDFTDRVERIVVNFGAGNIGHVRIEQGGQHADQTRFGLSAQTEQDEVVPGENGVDYLRNDRIFIADNSGEERFSFLDLADQVGAKLIFHAPSGNTFFGEATIPQLA